MCDDMLVLGVDGGATKTMCAVADEKFKVVGVGVAGPCNYNVVSVREARKNVKLAIKQACSNLNIRKKSIKIGCFGIGGLTTDRDYEIISREIVPSNIAEKRIIVNDVIVAFYAATRGEPGIVVVAGTGSIAYGLNNKGESAISNGWGWLMGDEGSAFDIARRALIAAAKAYDGRGEETILVDMFKKEFEVDDFKDIVPKIYHEVTSTKIAALSKIVFTAAKNGDKVAIKILKKAGEELGKAAVAIAKKIFMREETIIVGVSGGVFKADKIVWSYFKKYVSNFLPGALFVPPVVYPVIGALIMGYKNMGITVNEVEKSVLLQTLRERI